MWALSLLSPRDGSVWQTRLIFYRYEYGVVELPWRVVSRHAISTLCNIARLCWNLKMSVLVGHLGIVFLVATCCQCWNEVWDWRIRIDAYYSNDVLLPANPGHDEAIKTIRWEILRSCGKPSDYRGINSRDNMHVLTSRLPIY